MVPLTHYLILSAALFTIGLVGVVTRRNILVILMSVELMLNAANLAILTGARLHGDSSGHALVLFIMAVAASEVAVGLAIVISIFRSRGTVRANEYNLLRG